MSYCRFAWDGSDVYVFRSSVGLECCGCKLGPGFLCETPEEMIVHLAKHRRAGHFVPEYAIMCLWSEIPGADNPLHEEPEIIKEARRLMDEAQTKLNNEK